MEARLKNRFATRAIHDGQEPEIATGAVTVPIYLTSTYFQDELGKPRGGFEYSRTNNPSRNSLEKTIASIENGNLGLCYASGCAATTAILNLLNPGDEVISTIDIYGGTYRLFSQVYAKYGIKFKFLDNGSADRFVSEVTGKTKMVFIETPTNPMLNITDIQFVTERIEQKFLVVVDNTFATPFFQNPLDLGADIVVHSSTKYLGGHSDIIGGAIVTKSAELHERLKFYQNAAGAVPSPFDCFLIQRGIKTLEVRMVKHNENAEKVAKFLKENNSVESVFFPGLNDHPGHEIAKKQMRGQSGMVSFKIKGGVNEVKGFFSKLRVFMLAESLGGVESLACYPYTMTHGSIPASEKKKIGITENLIRLSVGIESIDDLISDLAQAL